MSTYKINFNDTLAHYGVLGMKWGVRKYQNFDGSYTKAGLKRYNKSLDTYEQRRNSYSKIKKDPNKSRYEKRYAKAKVKEAKRQLKKDYKHLRLDKKGDQGKVLYAEGKRITNNSRTTYMIAKAGSLIAIGAEYARQYGYIDTKTARAMQYASVGAAALSGIKGLLDEIPNSKLRAYYSHTSNY